jgi:MoaA/NifB/PqqE/SkfB family radical SAM enzyme
MKRKLIKWLDKKLFHITTNGAEATRYNGLQRINVLMQACNLRCPMCSMNLNNKEIGQILRDYPGASCGPQLTLPEYKEFFDQLGCIKPDVSFAGGEPTIFRFLPELVEYLKGKYGINSGITTNGTLFTQESRSRLLRTASAITVSVDGLEQFHDSVRGVGNFSIAVDALRKLLDQKRREGVGASISSLCCIQSGNCKDLEAIAEFLINEIGVEHLTFSFLIFSTNETLAAHESWRIKRDLPEVYRIKTTRGGQSSFEDFSCLDFEAIFTQKEKLKHRYKSIRFEPDFHSQEDLKTYFTTDRYMPIYFGDVCRPSRDTLTLISNGDILFFPQCFQVKLGNIRETRVSSIWQSDLFRQVRDTLSGDLSPVCSHCCANRVEKR